MFKHGFPPEWSTLKKLIWLVGSGIAGASYIWKTVTGALIHLTDALASPMQKCEVTLEPIQEGSGDPSPTNVRPITGWTGCEVTRTGKNVLQLPLYYRADLTLPVLFFIKAGDYYLSYTVSGATNWRVGLWMQDRNGNNLSTDIYKPSPYFSWYSNPGYWMNGSNSSTTEYPIQTKMEVYQEDENYL